ncbi:MAG TPA: OmpA family protein [Stellaceae bacterium]|nr:OmpA family protein [Stellaceae bacterium]
MRGKIACAAAVAAALSFAGGASHAEIPLINAPGQIYIGGEGGWTYLPDQTDHTNLPADFHVRYESGYNIGARLGFQWHSWRLEEEYNYRQNNNDRFDVGGVNVSPLRGNRHSHAIMTNVLYDFPVDWPIVPHIGAGIGALEVVDRVKTTPTGIHLININWLAGYQAIAGLRYDFHPNLSLELDYRYLASVQQPSFWVANNNGPPNWIHYRTGYETQNIVASLVFRCCASPPPPAVAPPAPPPPPPPAARQVFLVFFDWDQDVVTPEGMGILRQAAEAWRSGAPVRVQVTGYTDRSGSPGYNQRLSERRAANVAKALAELGIPRNEMAVGGRGENDNRVPTADGVREPQNRRVEIAWP